MKKYLVKITAIVLFIGVTVGCNEDRVVFNGTGNGTGVAAFNKEGALFGIGEDAAPQYIQVDVSSVSDVDRSITFNIDPASTALPAEYTIDSSSLFIPAGSFNGLIKVTGHFDALEAGVMHDIILNLEGVEGANLSTGKTAFKATIFRTCPIALTFGVGNYLFEEITDFVDGPTLESGTVIEVTLDPTDPTNPLKRTFKSYSYPQYCSSQRLPFNFSMICGEVIIPTGNRSNCVCNQNAPFIYGAPEVNGTYDPENDSVFYISFANDVTGNCNPVFQTTYKLTKQ